MKNILFVLAFVTPFALPIPASSQYGGIVPQSGLGTLQPNGNNGVGQWRDNNWRNGSANDWRTNNWRDDRTDDWRTNNWRDNRTDDWRPREDQSKDKAKTNKQYNASDDDCRRMPNSSNSYNTYLKSECR
jgi:hypothetical protein